MSGNVRVMKWLTAGYEAFLGIPLIGGAFIISFSWGPLVFAFFLHAIALFLSHKEGRSAYGNILGMVSRRNPSCGNGYAYYYRYCYCI